jgi:hypothetical protein
VARSAPARLMGRSAPVAPKTERFRHLTFERRDFAPFGFLGPVKAAHAVCLSVPPTGPSRKLAPLLRLVCEA